MKKYQTTLCVALGWALLAVWADLFGHSPGFAIPYSGLIGLGNMRVYWLVGLLVLAISMAALPRWFERVKRYLFFCLPLVASFGTMAFAVACQQTFFPPEVVALSGIIVAGAGYTWFTCLFCGMLAQTQCMRYAIGSIVASLALKTVLVQLFTGVLSASAQVGLAIALPLIITGFAFVAERGEETRTDKDEWRPMEDGSTAYRSIVPQIIVAVLVVATTRVMTPLGFFGDPLNLFSGAFSAAVGSVGVGAVLVALSYVLLEKRTKSRLSKRFMPAFLVIIFAYFLSATSASYQGMLAATTEVFITAIEALSHALFWTIMVTTIRLKEASPFRVVGLAAGLYDAISIIWVVFFFSLGVVNNAVIIVVAFVIVMLVVWLTDRNDQESSEVVPPDLMVDRRAEIAKAHGLSPRETEVFMMLAQGRSRTYISDELVVSEGTVKTHISHIYTKLGVHGRQEMFDLLLSGEEGEDR
ncbi:MULTISPECIES: helix-turn-helix transcriptional regulator [Gordonibacter]|uniref:Helix-turn-helix transcriptional regulator n=2 Tax=Gordonibacter TaxID=644652 RepID=A0ABT7DL14_9ACTN|nr:helix-turn-helix transcriptional regulator [Gordonibacter sp. KGMB12511]MDJ1650092.1 helix-turn-helix transcriptional regulator [Gordonibacter sp. KGMB12511]HIW75537.1 helix-turn-helix transcriptional regulator [Candidatus Gordonibacter avicola]